MSDVISILDTRSVNDRRGFCLGIFHRLSSLRAGLLVSPVNNDFYARNEAAIWPLFKMGGNLGECERIAQSILNRYPKEDEPCEFVLDMMAILCFYEAVKVISSDECRITAEVCEYFSETVYGTFQVLIYPGIVTREIRRNIDEHPQIKQEEKFLNDLVERCTGLDDAGTRENFEIWVKEVSAGDLWGPLRAEAARRGIRPESLY
jgi:hypothetical protein